MITKRMIKLRERFIDDNKEWVIEVKNKNILIDIITFFDSKNHTIDNVLHKIELDLMTNLHLDLKDSIVIKILTDEERDLIDEKEN